MNTDGSITAELSLQREELVPEVPGGNQPALPGKNTRICTSQRVFGDGQTLVVDDANTVDSKTDVPTRRLVFVVVSSVRVPQKQATQH